MSEGKGPKRAPAPTTYDDEPTIVWSPPDWDPEDGVDSSSSPRTAESQAPGSMPGQEIEVEVRRLSGPAALGPHARRTYEIWTRNRVYSVDTRLECVEVIDLATGRSDPNHAFLGARLVGGQLRQHDSNELTFPLPTLGSEAVFQKQDRQRRIRLSVTSRVTRVILHVHRVKVGSDERDGAWGKITRK